jgi:calcium permeable stress-gated cation channel
MEVLFKDGGNSSCPPPEYNKPGSTDIKVQLALSLVLGVSAFVAFSVSTFSGLLNLSSELMCCSQILRPRWSTLYAARKRRLDPLIGLPALPDSFFGWIPGLFKVTEEQVLASAGLDAFVVRIPDRSIPQTDLT